MLNNITSLNLSNCKSLSTLYCSANQLTQLDLSDCVALTHLNCTNNQLIRLDFSNCKSISDIGCGQNQLSTSALNDLFESLPMKTNMEAPIFYDINPGAEFCDHSILERKGWLIYDNEDDNKNADVYIKMGLEKTDHGDFDGAKEALEKAIELQPFSYHAHYFLGLSIGGYEGQKHLKKAITICTRIIETTPNHLGNALLFRGYAYNFLGFTDEAIHDFLDVVEISPKQWEAYMSLANIYFDRNKYDKAMEYLNHTLEIFPDNTDAQILKEKIISSN